MTFIFNVVRHLGAQVTIEAQCTPSLSSYLESYLVSDHDFVIQTINIDFGLFYHTTVIWSMSELLRSNTKHN